MSIESATNWIERVIPPPRLAGMRKLSADFSLLSYYPDAVEDAAPLLRDFISAVRQGAVTSVRTNVPFAPRHPLAEGYCQSADDRFLFWCYYGRGSLELDNMAGAFAEVQLRKPLRTNALFVAGTNRAKPWPGTSDVREILVRSIWHRAAEPVALRIRNTLALGVRQPVNSLSEYMAWVDECQAAQLRSGGRKDFLDDPLMYLSGLMVSTEREMFIWELYLGNVLIQDDQGRMLRIASPGRE
jgi:hypothetical protein